MRGSSSKVSDALPDLGQNRKVSTFYSRAQVRNFTKKKRTPPARAPPFRARSTPGKSATRCSLQCQFIRENICNWDQPRGLMVRVSDYKSWGPGFDSRFYHGNFSLQGKIPMVTMVWLVSRIRLKAPPVISSSCISPLTSSGQRSRASWAS